MFGSEVDTGMPRRIAMQVTSTACTLPITWSEFVKEKCVPYTTINCASTNTGQLKQKEIRALGNYRRQLCGFDQRPPVPSGHSCPGLTECENLLFNPLLLSTSPLLE